MTPFSKSDKILIVIIIFILAAIFVQVQFANAKTHGKVEKVGKTKPDKSRKDLNKKLKKLGKMEIPAGTYTDIELADLIRAAFGASIMPKKEKKVKKVKEIKPDKVGNVKKVNK